MHSVCMISELNQG